jgi:hypothetical protein
LSYTDDFYGPYAEYLKEPKVREVHNFALESLTQRVAFDHVLDLGCGLREYLLYRNPRRYLGVDTAAPKAEIRDNYRHFRPTSVHAIQTFAPKALVSLFSTELSAEGGENWEFYNSLFREFDTLNSALVSGVLYRGRWDNHLAPQIAGTQSFQTVDPLGFREKPNDLIHEAARLTLPCPSEFFGPDECEVWRLLVRKEV